MMPAQVLHQWSDLVRVSGVLDDVLDNGQDSGRVHPKRIGDSDPVDLDRTKLFEVDQNLGMAIEELLKMKHQIYVNWSNLQHLSTTNEVYYSRED